MSIKTSLSMPKSLTDVPVVSPNLMPFHIAYSGPAPTSTYFLKKPLVEPGTEKEAPTGSKSLKKGASDVQESASKEEGTAQTEEENQEARLCAAFRGRKVVSQSVQLPKGYTGLLLTQQTPNAKKESLKKDLSSRDEPKKPGKTADAKAKAAARAKALKAKATKLKKAKSQNIEEEEEEEDEDGDPEETVEETVIAASSTKQEEKAFQVTGRFEKFQLWQPDVPGDQGRDEYVRSLNEWIALTAEASIS